MALQAFLVGGFPRSARARHALRDLDEGRLPPAEAERIVVEEELLAIGAQLAEGLNPVADPVMGWHDLLRPFAEAWRNVYVNGLARFFDNNFFYRVPVFTGKPDPSRYILPARAKLLSERLPQGYRLKLLAPGPVTFALLSQNNSGASLEELAEEIARIIGEEARRAAEAGAAVLEVAEPWLGDPDAKPEHASLARDLVNRHIAGRGLDVILSIYYHPPSPQVARELEGVKASYIAVSYADAPDAAVEALKAFCPKGLALGVIDARSIYMEPLERSRQALERVRSVCNPDRLALTTTAGLDLIPFREAMRKVALLARHAEQLS